MMSNFMFGHNVFKSRLPLLHQNASAGWKGLRTNFYKIVAVKEEIVHFQLFSFCLLADLSN